MGNAALSSGPWAFERDAAEQAADPRSPLTRLEALTVDPLARGYVHVRGDAAGLDALARHLERSARAAGRRVVRVGGLPSDDAWRELAARVAAAPVSDPVAVAQALSARDPGAIFLVVEGVRTNWGRAVAAELSRLVEEAEQAPLVVALADHVAIDLRVRSFEIERRVGVEDLRRCWDALAKDAPLPTALERIEDVEIWWHAALSAPVLEVEVPELRADAKRLLARLVLSQRSWAASQITALGSNAARDELVGRKLLAVDASGRLVSTGAPLPLLETDRTDAMVVAEALDCICDGSAARSADHQALVDPWASARAGELFVLAGDLERGERAATRALGALTDASARADFWQRWEASLATLSPAEATPRLRRAADLALRCGDVDRAVGFARAHAARDDSYDAMLTLGRATTVRGDLTTAAIVLEKALAKAQDPGARARASVEMAEVRYTMGDLAAAAEHAAVGLLDATDAETRLAARNVQGKLLLARSAWAEAEQHFAVDACEAACANDLTAELRARLNRAIALLSSGRRDEARSMLGAVLEEGERQGEPRAVSFALQNLATIAILKHEYPDALSLAERAITVCRGIGEKIALARLITNLAELRLRLLGLTSEAEQALAFGRKACGPGIPAARAAHFALTAARIHLARGNTLEAAAELAAAMAAASSSSDGAKLGECHRVAARIALEDGDLVRAQHAIEKARDEATSASARADVALLDAQRGRAAGEPFLAAALEALDLAREGDDGELAREAHLLLHHARLEADDVRAARGHLDAALILRARVAEALPEELRRRFLARRDLTELARLEAAMAAGTKLCERCADPSCDGCARPSSRPPSERPAASVPRGIVGRDPAILALLAAIEKIGPSDATVLVHGESGTGKELVAEAIHAASGRKNGPLVKVNCAALVETLLLSELFGHEKGSFTGAAARRRGRFEMAEGGTLFLDEIGDISARTQVALLRVLQEKTFERVGGVTPIRANVRIVCATHRDLKGMVARGEFREDLYYRLRGVVLDVPALRNRLGDLGPIAAAILARVAGERGEPAKRVAPRTLDVLARHPWPGNVRELENALRAAALFAETDVLEASDFTNNVDGLRGLVESIPPPSISGTRAASAPDAVDFVMTDLPPPSIGEQSGSPTDVAYAHIRSGVSLSDMKRLIERDCIARALSESGGNITRAATLLGMKRPRLSQLVKQYGFGGVAADGADLDESRSDDSEDM